MLELLFWTLARQTRSPLAVSNAKMNLAFPPTKTSCLPRAGTVATTGDE